MKVNIWYDELWPAMIVTNVEKNEHGTLCEIPDELYEAWVSVNIARVYLGRHIANITGVKP